MPGADLEGCRRRYHQAKRVSARPPTTAKAVKAAAPGAEVARCYHATPTPSRPPPGGQGLLLPATLARHHARLVSSASTMLMTLVASALAGATARRRCVAHRGDGLRSRRHPWVPSWARWGHVRQLVTRGALDLDPPSALAVTNLGDTYRLRNRRLRALHFLLTMTSTLRRGPTAARRETRMSAMRWARTGLAGNAADVPDPGQLRGDASVEFQSTYVMATF